jgi:myo-inositol-1(or 4)-monophosphatase
MAALVASGEFAAAVFQGRRPWDAAAVKLMVEEAGGRVTNLFGQEQRYDRDTLGFVASNGLVHDELVQLMKKYVGPDDLPK